MIKLPSLHIVNLEKKRGHFAIISHIGPFTNCVDKFFFFFEPCLHFLPYKRKNKTFGLTTHLFLSA